MSRTKDTVETQEVIEKRKEDGIRIPLEKQVEAKATSNMFECIHLIHNALPEINLDDVDPSVTFLNHKFSAPILIDAMTGGTAMASKVNETLGGAAEELHLGMAVGSQRAGLKSENLAETYSIARKVAPTAFIAANIGGAQLAKGFPLEDAEKLVEMINANALIIHLNSLQELIQPEGEPIYKGVLPRIRELASRLKVPVIVKEVGAGISREVAVKLELAGVAAINVAGVGGTSWAGVEQHRAAKEADDVKADLGLLFWDWGIPTAAALIEARQAVNLPLISSGGLRNGLDVAKSLVLGAHLCGMALPMLRRAVESKEALIAFIKKTILEVRSTMYLVGAQNVDQLRKTRYVITAPLREWLTSSYRSSGLQ